MSHTHTYMDPKWAFWDDLPFRMRTAKVDMLGMGDVSPARNFVDTRWRSL